MNTSIFLSKHQHFVLLLALSVIGMAITKYYPAASHYYWLLMMLVFGLVSIASQYYGLQDDLQLQKSTLIQQGCHWLGGLFMAVIVNAYYHSGRIFTEETGLIMLLTLALSTYLEGAYRGWRQIFIGLYLGVIAVCAAYLDNYLWPLAFIAVLAGVFSHFSSGSAKVSASSLA